MTVYGVGNAAGAPVAVATQNLKNQQQSVASMPLNKASAAGSEENLQSLKRTKAFLTLAVLGTITYGLIRYKNAQALKPFIENLEKTTKDGGKLTTKLTKIKVKNPDGTATERVLKSVKTHFDTDGRKHAEIIHDFEKHERYSVFYDKDGNVTKNVINRMSLPSKNAKSKVEQTLTHVFTRNDNQVTTNTSLIDYSGKNPKQIHSFSKTEPILVSDTTT